MPRVEIENSRPQMVGLKHNSIRQHGRDGGGCLYTVIQWKTAASVLQRQASANGTGE